jgi:hypothetical protein
MLPPITENLFGGMHADVSLKTQPGLSQLAQNFRLKDGRWVPRDGFVRMTGGSEPSGDGICQGIYNFQELDGTVHTLAFANADMYEYNWGTNQWAMTDLSTKGVSVSAAAKLSFANSRGKLIVTDGVNTPWMWDGATTYTLLTEAPIANMVCVYYDRVFFFDATATNIKFEWSFPADPTDGYDADGNSWEFVQTDAGPVRGMAPLNNTLVILKEDSGSFLRGNVEATFETDAVREGLSESEGTISGHTVVIFDGDVYFLSQNGPRRAIGGQSLERINEDQNGNDRLADIWSTVDKTKWGGCHGFADTQNRLIWWFLPITGLSSGAFRTAIIYSVDDMSWATARFADGINIISAAEVENTSGDEYVLLGRYNGNVLRQNAATVQDDGSNIERILRSGCFGSLDPMVMKRLCEVRLHMLLGGNITFEVRPVIDGTPIDAATSGVTFDSGLHRYRKAFNKQGFTVGYEFYQLANEAGPEIHSAMTFLTAFGSQSTV